MFRTQHQCSNQYRILYKSTLTHVLYKIQVFLIVCCCWFSHINSLLYLLWSGRDESHKPVQDIIPENIKKYRQNKRNQCS